MNNIIFDTLIKLHSVYGKIPLTNSTAEIISNELLDFQEKEGMLPPSNPNINFGEQRVFEHEWEADEEI